MSTIHRLPASVARDMRGTALAVLLFGSLLPAAALMSSDSLERPQLAVLAAWMAIVIAGSATTFIRSFRSPDASAVTTSREGVRVGRGREVLWNEIVTGRPAKIGEALQLIGRDGEPLATIDYRVEGIDDVIDMLGRELAPHATEVRVFGSPRRRVTWAVINAAIAATTLMLVRQDMSVDIVLLTGTIGFGIFWLEGRKHLQRIEIDDDAVTLKTLAGRTIIRRDEVEAVKLTVRTIEKVRSLDVACSFATARLNT